MSGSAWSVCSWAAALSGAAIEDGRDGMMKRGFDMITLNINHEAIYCVCGLLYRQLK